MMVNNKQLVKQYNLSSVLHIFTGAAPLGKETASEIQEMFPSWKIRQGYGMTESATLTTSTSPHDIDSGSCGSLIPGVRARIVTIEGNEITGYDQPGELLISSPSVTLGYLNNDKANAETFQDGWLRTGDEAVVRLSPQGNEHIWIVDRIKELIKVKGLQVAPAELEAHLLAHPAVADCTVIPVPDDRAGEVPKAFVVKAQGAAIEDGDRVLIRDIKRHVEKSKARHKWLDGGVEFVDEIPKSPSGKILRRMLRDKEREKRRKAGAKL
jgi:acyl-CoA synthetase (AMP-forming)/AMP-acid ligase II